MPTTPKLILPYPAASDPADVPTDMQELAVQLDTLAGANSGLATLDSTGKVPASQLPAASSSGATRHSTRAKLVAAQAITATAGGVAATLDGEDWDTDNLHSPTTNNTRITIPTGLAGVWMFVGYMETPNPGDGSVHFGLAVRKNGSAYIGGGGPSANFGPGNREVVGASTALDVATVGDYYELMLISDAAKTIATATFTASMVTL